MKVFCKNCLNSCKKFGKIDCADYCNPTIQEIEEQINKLLVSQDNPELLKNLQKKIDYFNYGIL